MTKINTNAKGFVNFEKKDWGFAGDKGTWAKVTSDDDGNQVKLIVKRAAKGIVSEGFENEMSEFCADYGIDWDNVQCGQVVEVELYAEDNDDETETTEGFVMIDGHKVDFETVAHMMDDYIREDLHIKMVNCTDQEFMNAYIEVHLEKHNEEFVVN